MKRVTLLIIVLSLSFSLVSCGHDSDNNTDSEETTAVVEDGTYNESTESIESTEYEESTEVAEEQTVDESSGLTDYSYNTKTGLYVGNDDYMITDIDIIGYDEYNSGTPDYERHEKNTSIHIDYDLSTRTINQTINDRVGDKDSVDNIKLKRCDFPERLNVYDYPDFAYCSFLHNFDEIDNNYYLDSITHDESNIIGEHISIRPEENKYDVSDNNAEYTYDEEGRLVEYFLDSEYEPPEYVELDDPEIYKYKWLYDEQGRVIQFNNYFYEETFEYDENNLPIKVNVKDFKESGSKDESGRLLEYEEYSVYYVYDEYGRIIGIDKSDSSGSDSSPNTQITYDENGNVLSVIINRSLSDGYSSKCYFYTYALKEDIINNAVSNDALTPGKIYNAVKKYCIEANPDLDLSSGGMGATWSMPPAPMEEEYAITFNNGNGSFQTHYVNYNTGQVRAVSESSIEYNVYDYLE